MLLPSGNPFKCHEEVLYLQPMIPPNVLTCFPFDWGMLRRSRRVLIFLSNNSNIFLYQTNNISVQYKPVALVAQLVTLQPSDTLGREIESRYL